MLFEIQNSDSAHRSGAWIGEVAQGNLLSSFVFPVLIVGAAALYFGRRKQHQASSLPGMKSQPLLIYYTFFRSFYSNTLKHIHPLSLLLQALCGFCTLFDKERIAHVWFLNRRVVFFYKPETVEVVLSSTVQIEKSYEYRFLHPWLGSGLFTSKGGKWRYRRKLLTPAFHFRILEEFLPIFDEQSQVLVSKLKTLTNKPWVDIVPLINMCALDIICQTAMGVKINAQSGGYSDYVTAIHEISELFLHRSLRPWLWIDSIFYYFPSGRKFKANLQIVHNFTRKVIKEKKQKMLEKYSKNPKVETNDSPPTIRNRRAFLEILLEQHLTDKSLTEEDIQEEVDTFMFAGHDTTGMSICWSLYNLGLHLDVQDGVHKELDSIFEDDVTQPITRDDLCQMKYLDCVLKETLRLYPPVPFIGRELKEDIKVLDYRIPTGTTCILFPLMLHRDPVSFPNPEKFDPERFFPENYVGRHPYAYVPFSAGPRNCLGQKFAVMEEKAVVANILRYFRVVSLDHRDKVSVIPDIVTRNVEPLRMRLIARHNKAL